MCSKTSKSWQALRFQAVLEMAQLLLELYLKPEMEDFKFL